MSESLWRNLLPHRGNTSPRKIIEEIEGTNKVKFINKKGDFKKGATIHILRLESMPLHCINH